MQSTSTTAIQSTRELFYLLRRAGPNITMLSDWKIKKIKFLLIQANTVGDLIPQNCSLYVLFIFIRKYFGLLTDLVLIQANECYG